MMEVMIVIRCGSAPVPTVLGERPRIQVSEVPTKDEVNRALAEVGPGRRLVLCGTDAALAAVLTRLLRTENLDAEIAYVADEPTPATRAYGLPTGSEAAKLGIRGTSREVPLVRDETGTALVGEALVRGPEGDRLVGEAYADDTVVFSGETDTLTVRPTPELPGVRATAARPRWLRRRQWVAARAVQLGTEAGLLTRDGLTGRRAIKRTTFYRHTEPWRLVSP
ncbi:hypothetical protein SAMN06265174_10358 [Dietzia kunjamensis subsp. schimae]|uniref:Uncharacterized protein n=2 Tax=Dietzia kunjamensis TaxID=322509 RepID=A0ABY1N021_9ACTN|nr:hypothetical protein SAMN06265174_10358 [Dietzia kunjamensis subsp. schimae]